MIIRSKEFWIVAIFLSKFGEAHGDNVTLPPKELNVMTWKEAYKSLFKSLGKDRTESSFANSMKNARDSFDSHIENSPRAGWKDNKRKPALLPNIAKEVYGEYSSKTRDNIWKVIKGFLK
jgi:hypothetical protein